MKHSTRNILTLSTLSSVGLATVAVAVAGGGPNTQIGSDLNSTLNPFVQPQDPALSGGGRDQTLQFGDLLLGTGAPDLLIGLLGTDLFAGSDGDDVLVGGPEHFNPSNRDRAFGGNGDDVFLWSPGDGSDFYSGGPGLDAVVFGLIGQVVDGEVEFAVSTDQLAGDVYLNPGTGLPIVDATNSPGFCNVIDDSSTWDAASQLDSLGLDHLVQFFIRSAAESFAAGTQTEDNGLRVTLHLEDVEFVVCTSEEGGQVEAFDLRVSPPQQIRLREVPIDAVQLMVK